MRHKKEPPPPPPPSQPPSLEPQPAPLAQATIEKWQSITVIERVLENALEPTNGVTPGQLRDLAEMFITLMFLRGVAPEYWFVHIKDATTIITLAKQIEAEAALMRIDQIPKEAQATIEAGIELSLQEISGLRKKLLETLQVLKQMAPPGVKIH